MLIEPIYAWLPDDPSVERRKLFGYSSPCMNSNLFTGICEDNVAVRLSEETWAERASIVNVFKTVPGHKMREYLWVPNDSKADNANGLTYATTQPKPLKMKKAT